MFYVENLKKSVEVIYTWQRCIFMYGGLPLVLNFKCRKREFPSQMQRRK